MTDYASDWVLILSILTRAREALVRKGWTQGLYARDASHSQVTPDDEYAVCFCSMGAVYRYIPKSDKKRTAYHIHALFACVLNIDPTELHMGEWNDDPKRTKEDVLSLYDKAISVARVKQVGGSTQGGT